MPNAKKRGSPATRRAAGRPARRSVPHAPPRGRLPFVSAHEYALLKKRFLKDLHQLRKCLVCPAVEAIKAVRAGEPNRKIDRHDWNSTAIDFIRIFEVDKIIKLPGGP